MEKCCGPVNVQSERFKKAVLIALFLNFSMFIFEMVTSYLANSSSLKADALDFLGDSANYVISLYVLNKIASMRSKASLIKGITMTAFAAWILIDIFMNLTKGIYPQSDIMGWTGGLALVVNLIVAMMLYKFREGDSNMQSVWICSRNDAIGNVAVIIAAVLVGVLNSNIPDLVVAFLMVILSGTSGIKVIKVALNELRKNDEPVPSISTCSTASEIKTSSSCCN